MSLVLDASIALTWCFEDESTPRTKGILDQIPKETVIVPAIWIFEVVNGCLVGIRAKRISAADAMRFLAMLEALPVEVEAARPTLLFSPLLNLASQHGLSAYDTAYLALAIRHRASLATVDVQLRRCATKMGVAVLP